MNKKQSSPEMAKIASRVLLRISSPKTEKSLAGSVLSQAESKPKKIMLRVKK